MKRLIAIALALVFAALTGNAMAADTNTMSVSANVVGTCKFSSAASSLAFGNIDPSLATDATASASADFWCTKGASYSVSDDLGLHEAGVQMRMQHDTTFTEYIPYAISYTNSGTGTGKTTPITFGVAGTIANADYVDALAGNYTDTVVLTITP